MTAANTTYHPYCFLFPEMDSSEYESLKEDIKANGLREPVIMLKGQILDGRNRHNVCQELGIEETIKEVKTNDPLGYVISANLRRRHLDDSQRAAIAAEIANLKQGGQHQKTKNTTPNVEPANLPVEVKQSEAAEMLHVSERLVRDAKKVKEESPEKFEEVKEGKKTINKAIKEIKNTKQEPQEVPENNIVTVKFTPEKIKELAERTKQKNVRTEISNFAKQMSTLLDTYFSLCKSESEKNEYVKFAEEISYFIFGTLPNIPQTPQKKK